MNFIALFSPAKVQIYESYARILKLIENTFYHWAIDQYG